MWAFGTSRDGLGLTPARLWSLTRREYSALRKVYDDSRRAGDTETSPTAGVSVQSTNEKKARLRGMFLAASGGKRRE